MRRVGIWLLEVVRKYVCGALAVVQGLLRLYDHSASALLCVLQASERGLEEPWCASLTYPPCGTASSDLAHV